jgi:hypothetical protein
MVRARVSCPEGCDLRSGLVNIVGSEEVVLTAELAGSEGAETAETADLVLNAPAQLGEGVWSITFPRQEVEGVVHEECSLSVTSTIVPHATSVAVWGVPSPVKGSRFGVMVGLKLGHGRLGDVPRPGTSALYEGEVSLVAPSRAGVFFRSVSFAPIELGSPHREVSGDFTFRSLEPPEHTVTVQVIPKGIDAPMDNIEVRLGAYRAETDERGLARVGVPKGTYELSAWRIDIEPASTELEVTGDAMVEIDATPRQVVDEDDDRAWM